MLGYAVENGVLKTNAMRQGRTVRWTAPRATERDPSRAMTRAERGRVIEVADAAVEEGVDPRTRRKRQATADLVAFLRGTGARIDEARRVRWEDVDLEGGRVDVRGTKTESSDRRLNLPGWLLERLTARAGRTGTNGLLFAAPASVSDPRSGLGSEQERWSRLGRPRRGRALLGGLAHVPADRRDAP